MTYRSILVCDEYAAEFRGLATVLDDSDTGTISDATVTDVIGVTDAFGPDAVDPDNNDQRDPTGGHP